MQNKLGLLTPINDYQARQNTLAIAGLGACVQINATSTVQLAAGFQSADNITGSTRIMF